MRSALAQQIRNGHFKSGLPLPMSLLHAPGQPDDALQKWLAENRLTAR